MQWVTRLIVSVLLNTARALIINFERYTMKYREKLAQQFAGLEKLSGSTLQILSFTTRSIMTMNPPGLWKQMD